MKRIKISKKQWDALSKKAQAPTTAPTKTPVRTPSAPTKDPGKKSPFNPPRPKVDPAPKAKAESEKKNEEDNTFAGTIDSLVRLAKAYEEGAVEPVRNFWTNIPEDHPFYHNEILKEYGHNLSKEGYEHIVKKMEESGEKEPTNTSAAMMESMQIIRKILQLEAQHSEELIDEAKNITAQVWGIDKEQLNAILGQGKEEGQEGGQEGQEDDQEEQENTEINPNIRSEINKRIMMNTMTQGSAVHAMQSVHHLVAEKINQISPELLKLYTRLSNIATHHYYTLDIPAVVQMMKGRLKDAAIGWSHVEFKEETPKVVAQGLCFPVLCQELFKGVMELISMHGINQDLSEQELKTVYKHADRLEDEPWLIMVGPALWRKFLNVIPKDINMSELIMKLSQEAPKDLEKIIKSVIQNPNLAKQYMQKYIEPKETYQESNTPESPDLPDIPDDFGDEKYFKK